MTSPFGDLSPEEFLQEYWQKKPLLVRRAFDNLTSPLSPEELAGLACDYGVTSRLIIEKGGEYPWEVRFGPFEEDDFAGLPPSHWTLLVQETDRHVPAAADLLRPFRFLPNWRIDDVQISYAPMHGRVGAHIDQYDVFLIQGLGRRRWQIKRMPAPPDEPFVKDLDIELLEHFEPDEEWIVSPGDLLYLPPRIPHCGTALSDCMTISVGFRAPGNREIVEGFLEHATSAVDPDLAYTDRGRQTALNPGKIGPGVLRYVQDVLRSAVEDRVSIRQWFGSFATEPNRGMPASSEDPPSTRDIMEVLGQGGLLRRRAPAYLAYIEHDSGVSLYACGVEYPLSDELAFAAPLLSGTTDLSGAALEQHMDDPAFVTLLAELIETGALQLCVPSVEEHGL